ncbi:hypothetical protein [Pedobacter duraquae]|nr:hypothetical protein [Pedobacter duraquae]
MKMHHVFVKEVVERATTENKWVFHKITKRWYTPEEYMASYDGISYDGRRDWENVEVRNPMDGLAAASKILKDVSERREILEKRIFEYYQQQNIKKFTE